MTTDEAYRIICEFFSAQDNLVDSFYDEVNFGNFVIDCKGLRGGQSIVCDRSQIYICDKPGGEGECELVLASIYEITDRQLMQSLGLHQ